MKPASETFVRIELLPHEQAILRKGIARRSLIDQLPSAPSSEDIVTVMLSRLDLRFLASDLTHAIVKRGWNQPDHFDFAERLDYIVETDDGSLATWYE